jgi:hypothetical protein
MSKQRYATKEIQVKAWTNKGTLGVWVMLETMQWVKASKALASILLNRKD